ASCGFETPRNRLLSDKKHPAFCANRAQPGRFQTPAEASRHSLLIYSQLAHFRADQIFVPAHTGAIGESLAPFEKAASQNIHVQKTQERPARNATQDRFERAI